MGRSADGSIQHQKVLDVVPSTVSEMVFETRNKLFNHKVNIILFLVLVSFLLLIGLSNIELLWLLIDIIIVRLPYARL